jgi:hypothetical protein
MARGLHRLRLTPLPPAYTHHPLNPPPTHPPTHSLTRSTPHPPERTCGALTNAKSARRATSSSPSPSVRQGWGAGTATHDAGGLPHGSSYFLGPPWLRPRDPEEAQGAARQRRCPVKYKPPPQDEQGTNCGTKPFFVIPLCRGQRCRRWPALSPQGRPGPCCRAPSSYRIYDIAPSSHPRRSGDTAVVPQRCPAWLPMSVCSV